MAAEPLLSSEEVASILGSNDGESGPSSPRSYSLRRPVALAPEAEPLARKRLKELASSLQQALRAELGAAVHLQLQGFQQELAVVAIGTLPDPAWILSFVAEGGGGMALALDPCCALGVVELALGGAGNTAASGREATPLESRVMNRLCGALAGRLLRDKSPALFGRGLFTQQELPDELAAPGQTVGVGLLRLRVGDAACHGLLLATCDLLRPARPRGETRSCQPGPLAPLVERIPLKARVVLHAGLISVADLAALEPGAVLRLEAADSSMVDLRANGRALFKGTLLLQDGPLAFSVKWRRGRRRTARS